MSSCSGCLRSFCVSSHWRKARGWRVGCGDEGKCCQFLSRSFCLIDPQIRAVERFRPQELLPHTGSLMGALRQLFFHPKVDSEGETAAHGCLSAIVKTIDALTNFAEHNEHVDLIVKDLTESSAAFSFNFSYRLWAVRAASGNGYEWESSVRICKSCSIGFVLNPERCHFGRRLLVDYNDSSRRVCEVGDNVSGKTTNVAANRADVVSQALVSLCEFVSLAHEFDSREWLLTENALYRNLSSAIQAPHY